VRLATPIGSAAGGSANLSTSLSNVAKVAAHPKFVWVFNANCDGTTHVVDKIKPGNFDNVLIIEYIDSFFALLDQCRNANKKLIYKFQKVQL
jgi:hypothetical protein